MSQAEHQILPRQAIAKHSRIYWNVSWHILVTTYLTMLIANFTHKALVRIYFSMNKVWASSLHTDKKPLAGKRERERESESWPACSFADDRAMFHGLSHGLECLQYRIYGVLWRGSMGMAIPPWKARMWITFLLLMQSISEYGYRGRVPCYSGIWERDTYGSVTYYAVLRSAVSVVKLVTE